MLIKTKKRKKYMHICTRSHILGVLYEMNRWKNIWWVRAQRKIVLAEKKNYFRASKSTLCIIIFKPFCTHSLLSVGFNLFFFCLYFDDSMQWTHIYKYIYVDETYLYEHEGKKKVLIIESTWKFIWKYWTTTTVNAFLIKNFTTCWITHKQKQKNYIHIPMYT